jgi:excinuclease UvrABC nuclease subunit
MTKSSLRRQRTNKSQTVTPPHRQPKGIFRLPARSINELKNLPTEPAIYYVTGFWLVFYVGKAKNLRRRWTKNHHRYLQFQMLGKLGRLHYRILPLSMIDQYERQEIQRLSPPWNGTKPPNFWSLLKLGWQVWGRVIIYSAITLLVIAVVIYWLVYRV